MGNLKLAGAHFCDCRVICSRLGASPPARTTGIFICGEMVSCEEQWVGRAEPAGRVSWILFLRKSPSWIEGEQPPGERFCKNVSESSSGDQELNRAQGCCVAGRRCGKSFSSFFTSCRGKGTVGLLSVSMVGVQEGHGISSTGRFLRADTC